MSTRVAVVDPPPSLSTRHIGVPPSVCAALGVDTGDVVSIEGSRRTAAVVERVDATHDGVCLSQPLRENARVERGESVRADATTPPRATAVQLRLDRSIALTSVESSLRRRLKETPVTVGDAVTVTHLDGALTLRFVIESVDPASPAIVDADTTLSVQRAETPETLAVTPAVSDPAHTVPNATYQTLRDIVVPRLHEAEAFESAGRPATLGLLLSGPRGSGKTTLVEAVASAADARFVPVSLAAVRGQSGGDQTDRLERVIEAASDPDPVVVLLDDLEVLSGDATGTPLGDRLRVTLDELRSTATTIIIGATTDADSVPDALRRGGRFDREVTVDPLTSSDRRQALEQLTDAVPLAMDVDLSATADRIAGFVLADITALVDVAVERAVCRDGRTAIRQADIDAAVDAIDPTGLRDVAVELPTVAWDDVGGLAAAKREIIRAVYWPLEYAARFDQLGVDPPSGVLLAGPPGTGKTLLARAAATLSDANFISVNGPELLDRYVGESERAVRELFATARENAPAVVFFDEVDAISSRRRGDDTGVGERVVSQLLTELDGLEPLTDVVVVAATNRPEMIDEALLRPGRIETTVETPLPDAPARREILAIHTRETPLASHVDLESVARQTAGYSGGDLAAVIREAAMLAIEDTIGPNATADPVVDTAHLEAALQHVTPSVSADSQSVSLDDSDTE